MRLSMRLKFAMSAAVLAVLGCLAVSILAYQLTENEILLLLRERVAADARTYTRQVAGVLDGTAAQARILAAAPAVRRLLSDDDAVRPDGVTPYDDVERLFMATLRQRSAYSQLRALDVRGYERLRAQRIGQRLEVVDESDLQDKAARDYMQAAVALGPGDVYVSRLDLNIEHGRIERPIRPVIRIVVPVFAEGRRLGFVVVNIDGEVLQYAEPGTANRHLLADERGNLLVHPDPRVRFGAELGTGESLETLVPGLAADLAGRQSGVLRSAIGLSVAEPVLIAFERLRYAPGDDDRHWLVISEVPQAVSFAPLNRLTLQLAWVSLAVIVGAAIVGGLFGHWLSRPLTRLTDMAHRLSVAKLDTRAALQRHDEVGVLGQALDHMAEQLQMLLRAEVKARQELAATAAELKRSNTDLEQFAYIASHDLKAPLRGIDHLASWLAEDLEPHLTDESRNHLATLRGRVQRLEDLLDGILSFSRAGRKMRADEAVDTEALVREVVDLYPVPETFTVHIQAGLPLVMGDPAALQQVFVNLIGNAIKHHDRSDGTIRITATEADDHYRFTITDDGPGIDPLYRERVFRMFQTLKPRDTVEGSGIGLAVVRRIVERVGGQVSIVSSEGERGCSVCFTWPKPGD